MTKPHIYFYSAKDPYGYFSNFSLHPFVLNGKKWPTSEHYFQAQKFAGKPLEEQVRCSEKPGDAFRLGQNKEERRRDWQEVKESVMKEALIAKFTQHRDLHEALLATKGKLIAEHTKRDSYWGDGLDGSGKNRLGHLLMEVRDEFLGIIPSSSSSSPLSSSPPPSSSSYSSCSSSSSSLSSSSSSPASSSSSSSSSSSVSQSGPKKSYRKPRIQTSVFSNEEQKSDFKPERVPQASNLNKPVRKEYKDEFPALPSRK